MLLAAISLSLFQVQAHITLNPNYGAASGGYFSTTVKIPHGEPGMHTTRLVIHVPHGILSIRPEVPSGWSANVTEYLLAPEDRYTSHGSLVTTGPDKVIFQALTTEAALYTDHLMLITLQLRIGCSFHDQVQADYTGSNSIWQGQYTLWFKMEQHSSHDDTLVISKTSLWTGALADTETSSPSWNPPSSSGLKACPYLFIHAGQSCSIDHSGSQKVGGMEWMMDYVDPATNQGQVRHEQHVIELATEAALSVQEGLDLVYSKTDTVNAVVSNMAALTSRIEAVERDQNTTLTFAIIGFAISIACFFLLLALFCFRVFAKSQFARVVSAVPLMSEHSTTAAKLEYHSNAA